MTTTTPQTPTPCEGRELTRPARAMLEEIGRAEGIAMALVILGGPPQPLGPNRDRMLYDLITRGYVEANDECETRLTDKGRAAIAGPARGERARP